MKTMRSILGQILATASMLKSMFPQNEPNQSEWHLEKRAKGIRNPKDPIKKAAIERRRKAKRLSMLSKPKRRAVYRFNLHHPAKMFKAESMYA